MRHRNALLQILAVGLPSGVVVLACYSDPGTNDARGGSVLPASGCQNNIESIRTKIFMPRCATSGCHTGQDPEGSLELGLTGVDARLIGVSATECGEQTLVTPGAPDTSYLLNKLTATKPACGDHMPATASSLHPSDIECIRSWIDGLSADAGAVKDAGATCPTGKTLCGTTCVDTTTDPKNCGKCATVCGVACAAGSCVESCPASTQNCSGSCVDVTSSEEHCGACGKACTGGKVCTAGACACGAPVSFGAQIQDGIFAKSCVDAGCHSGVKPKSNLRLTSKADSLAGLVNAPSSACNGRIRVVPSDADKSYLMNKLTGVGMCAGTLMPKAGQSLPAAQIDQVRSWICNGAPNN